MSDENLTNIPPFQHKFNNKKKYKQTKNIIIVCIINVLDESTQKKEK